MSRNATVRSVNEAMQVIKAMDHQGFDWAVEAHAASRLAVKGVLERLMADTVDARVAAAASRAEAPDRRNGHYSRWLLTALGEIELSVPRSRRCSGASVLKAYARREASVDRLILSCFVLGLSTRKVGRALGPLLGVRVAPATVSRVARTLDAAVAAWHARPLGDGWRALVLDGVVLARKSGAGALRRPVLVALGLRPDGRKEVIDFRLARAESQAEWTAFLTDLHRRGLTGEGLEIVGVDGGPGLAAALPLCLPGVPVQRCWAHKARNILDKVRKADRAEAKRGLARIYQAETLTAARHQARRWADRWEEIYPKAVACLRDDLEELLSFFRFERAQPGQPDWRKMTRTTNAIERRFREVRRRTRPMGVFQNTGSMERILYAVFINENQQLGTATPFLLTHNS
jgi:putative transposase